MEKVFAAILFATLFSSFVASIDFASIGTNYNLQNYHYSKGWVEASPCQAFYPSISVSRAYPSYYSSDYGNYAFYYSNYPSNYGHYSIYYENYACTSPSYSTGAHYRLPELKPPLPYPYIASPADLGFAHLRKRYYAHPSGSAAKAYYTAPAQVHLNVPASSTYPPGFYSNSFNAAASYGNLQEQQYYIKPDAAAASDSPGYASSERVSFQQAPYAYSGGRWLEEPNYWQVEESAVPRTSSTFPPSFFLGYYSSAKPQAYYDSFQANEPVKQLAYAGKKPLLVITGSTPAPQN